MENEEEGKEEPKKELTEKEQVAEIAALKFKITLAVLVGVALIACLAIVTWISGLRLIYNDDGVPYYLASLSPWTSTNDTSIFYVGDTWRKDSAEHLYLRKIMVVPEVSIRKAKQNAVWSAGRAEFKGEAYYQSTFKVETKAGFTERTLKFWIPEKILLGLLEADGIRLDFNWLTNNLRPRILKSKNAADNYPVRKYARVSTFNAFQVFAHASEADSPARRWVKWIETPEALQ